MQHEPNDVPSHENLITGLVGEIFRAEASPSNDKNDDRKAFLVLTLVGALFLVTATEPFKVILRKNIGRHAFNFGGIILSSVLYIGWAAILVIAVFAFNGDGNPIEERAPYFQYLLNQYIILSGAICYLVFAIYVFVRGMDESYRLKADNRNDLESLLYRGDSIFVTGFSQKNIEQKHLVWRETEPKACFTFGLVLMLIHPLIGFPMFLSAISFWFNEWYQIHLKSKRMQESYRQMQDRAAAATTFYNKFNNPNQSNGGILN